MRIVPGSRVARVVMRVVIPSLLAVRVANGQLLDTGPGSFQTPLVSGYGYGPRITVSTPTTLTQIGFYVQAPERGGHLKYVIFDATNTSLLFSTVVFAPFPIPPNTLTLSNPFSFVLDAGSTYHFGILSDHQLAESFFNLPDPVSQNGLTSVGKDIGYSGYLDPVYSVTGGQGIAIALFGTQGSTITTPEPTSLALVATGLAGLCGAARRRRRQVAGDQFLPLDQTSSR